MPRFRFTQKALDELKTDGPRLWAYDEQVPLLAMMVTATGAKAFYAIKTTDGKKRHVRIGPYPEVPIALARQRAADVILKMISGEVVGAEKRAKEKAACFTLSAAYSEYHGYLERHRKASSISQYERLWNKHLGPWAGERSMRDIRRREVVALHQNIGDHNGHHLANRVVAFLRAIINRAIREHEMDIPNPANAITFYREDRRSRRLMPEELPAFFQAVREEPNEDIRDFILVALFTGARKSNVLSMRWSDISLDRALWIVPKGDSKNSKELDVVLPTRVVEILTSRQTQTHGLYVFPGRRGVPHMMDPKIGWMRICERAGLQGLHMHDLRRSLASFQIDAGAPLEVIQKTLGHESKTTTEIYARMALETVRASVERAVGVMLKGETT